MKIIYYSMSNNSLKDIKNRNFILEETKEIRLKKHIVKFIKST